jgi:hypothetical protein
MWDEDRANSRQKSLPPPCEAEDTDVVIAICMGTFLGGRLSFSLARNWSIRRIAYSMRLHNVRQPKHDHRFLFLGCFAMGWMEVVELTITGIAIDSQAGIGTAVGMAGSMRSTVSIIASTIYTAILTNRFKKAITREVLPNLIAAGLPSSVASFCQPSQLGHMNLWVKSRS